MNDVQTERFLAECKEYKTKQHILDKFYEKHPKFYDANHVFLSTPSKNRERSEIYAAARTIQREENMLKQDIAFVDDVLAELAKIKEDQALTYLQEIYIARVPLSKYAKEKETTGYSITKCINAALKNIMLNQTGEVIHREPDGM